MPTVYRDFFGNVVAQSAPWTDTITGSSGSEKLTGTSGDDLMVGGGAGHPMKGGLGDDTYQVNVDNDLPSEKAGEGVDTIQVRNIKLYTLGANIENLFLLGKMTGVGNDQANLIVGNLVSQTIVGGAGDDVLEGGKGADTFVFGAGSGYDVVTDFSSTEQDKVRIQDYGFGDFAQVTAAMTQVGSDVVLQLDPNDAVKFLNTTIASFHAADFQLALDTANLNPTFDDEFDSLSLYDPATGLGTWSTSLSSGEQTGPRAYTSRTLRNNDERELYVDPNFPGSGAAPLGLNPFSINGGVLDITASVTPDTLKPSLWYYRYTSGLLTTQHSFAQTYGYFEIRAELPSGKGVWPAFWLLPAAGGSPPELDVMENIGAATTYFTSHSKISGVQGTTASVSGTSTQFHTYGLLWTNKELTWYVDGVAVFSIPTPPDMNKPMYMLVDLAIGGSFPGPVPSSFTSAAMHVDYVRAYSLNAAGGVDPDLGVSVSQGAIGEAQKSHAAFTVTGLDAGSSGVVSFTDSLGHSVAVSVAGNGAGVADLSSLADGAVTVSVSANAPDGSTLPGTGQTFTIDPSVDGDLTVSPPFASAAVIPFTVSGLDPGDTALVVFTDSLGHTVTASVSANGAASANLAGLIDGVVTASITESDGDGHTFTGVGGAFNLDTTADVGGDLAIKVTNSVNAAGRAHVAFTLPGIDRDIDAVVTFTDSAGHTVSTIVNSDSVPFVDLSSLADGLVTVSAVATDDVGNTAIPAPVHFTLDTTADVGGDLAVTTAALVGGASKGAAGFVVSGLDPHGSAVVSFTDQAGHVVTADVTANGSGAADLSALADGPVHVTIAARDGAGNTATGAGDTLTLDSTADAGGDLAVALATTPPGATDRTAVGFTVAGLDADTTAVLTFTDSDANVVTHAVSANGSGTVDLSALADGAVQVAISASDAAGNTATGAGGSLTLDDGAAAGSGAAVAMDAALVGSGGLDHVGFTVSGLDAADTAILTFTDAAGHTVTADVAANGHGAADLTGLTDGPIAVATAVSEAGGGLAAGAGAGFTLDTNADHGGDLAASVPRTAASAYDKTYVPFSVAGLDADATAVVTFADADGHAVNAEVTANGAGIANLSSLDAGAVAVTVEATDAAGNTAAGAPGDTIILAPGAIDPIASSTVILGGAGAQQLTGGPDNDLIVVGPGDDMIDGGGGSNTVSYDAAAAGVKVALVATAQHTGGSGTDTLANIQNMIGSHFNDALTGDAGANILIGGDGADTLKGGDGDDLLAGGAGDDVLSGSTGVDTASYFDAASGVTVNLLLTTPQDTGGAGTDTLTSIENLTGSDFADVLTGGKSANVMMGGDGDDILTGGAGADVLFGGAGADRFVYLTTKDSTVAAPDQIVDFSHTDGDRIDLSAIDANTKTGADDPFTLAAAFTHLPGQLIQLAQAGGYLVEGDVNGDAKPDFAIFVHTAAPLIAGDFVL